MTRPLGPELADLPDLVDAVCDESATREQIGRLEELIAGHPAAADYYVRAVRVSAGLMAHFAPLSAPRFDPQPARPRRWVPAVGAAASAVALAAVLVTLAGLAGKPTADATAPTPPGTAAASAPADRGVRPRASAAAPADSRYAVWAATSKVLAADPSLLVYYPFDGQPAWDRTLSDARPGGDRDGTVVGATWAAGRWPGKKALRFKEATDRVVFFVPGEHRSVSLAAWFRLDDPAGGSNPLMMSTGSGAGAAHWRVQPHGTINLGVRGVDDKWINYNSPLVFGPARAGRWTHAVTVSDGDARTVTHYVDGTQVAVHRDAAPARVRIADADLGNWAPRSYPNESRSLNGRIDEFALFARPLTAAEVAKLYSDGRPE